MVVRFWTELTESERSGERLPRAARRVSGSESINRIFRQEVRIFRMDRRWNVHVFAAAFLELKPVFLLCALCVLGG
jgi:hypothetical protein